MRYLRIHVSLSVMSTDCPTARQPVEPMSRDEQAGKPDVDVTVMGAKWGAISGRHEATRNLLHRSIPVVHQESSDA